MCLHFLGGGMFVMCLRESRVDSSTHTAFLCTTSRRVVIFEEMTAKICRVSTHTDLEGGQGSTSSRGHGKGDACNSAGAAGRMAKPAVVVGCMLFNWLVMNGVVRLSLTGSERLSAAWLAFDVTSLLSAASFILAASSSPDYPPTTSKDSPRLQGHLCLCLSPSIYPSLSPSLRPCLFVYLYLSLSPPLSVCLPPIPPSLYFQRI